MTEPTATEFTPTFTWYAGNGAYYYKDTSQSTSTSVFYEMKTRDSSGNDTTASWIAGQYGIEFRYENGNTVLYCNTGNNTDIPYTFGGGVVSQQVAVGDSVTATLSAGGTAYTFTVTSDMLWTVPTNNGTGTEGVNTPYVTWLFPNRSCGDTTFVSVTHTEATSNATTYTVHDETEQIGTILVGTASDASANFGFTISARTLYVKNAAGSSISTRVFTCGTKKVHSNCW